MTTDRPDERADRLRERIVDQFSYGGPRADVWRALDRLLDTDAFLNLGYSGRFRPHVVGSSQRRLASVVGTALADRLPRTEGVRLLDVGCGRGGPALYLAEEFGFRVRGVDLVPYNVARAAENARQRGVDAEFVVGEATRLPFARSSVGACVAVDSFVYLPDRSAAFAALAEVLAPGGVVVLSDLVARPGLDDAERRTVSAFARAWDMPPPGSVPAYERALVDAGLAVVAVEDLTPHSVGRLRTWSGLFCRLAGGPAGPLVDRLLAGYGLDPSVVTGQVRRAHEALPHLRHVLVVAEG